MHIVPVTRTLYLASEINLSCLGGTSLAIASLQEESEEWISLYITSPGGEIKPAMSMYDFIIRFVKPHLQTIIVRQVNSAAILIALAGEHRVIESSATFFFHQIGQIVSDGNMNSSDLKTILKELRRLEDIYADIVSLRSGRVSRAEVLKLMRKETLLTSQEAFKMGFVHEII